MRTRLLGRLATAVVVAALFGEPAVSAASRSILVVAPSPDDDRIEPAHEAIAFWNERLEEFGVETRLAGPRLVVASPSRARSRTTPAVWRSAASAFRAGRRNRMHHGS